MCLTTRRKRFQGNEIQKEDQTLQREKLTFRLYKSQITDLKIRYIPDNAFIKKKKKHVTEIQ